MLTYSMPTPNGFKRIRRTSAPIYRVEDRGYVTQCWTWLRTKNDRGYGRCQNDHGKLVSAHRYIWECENGPVPQGLELDHLCRNRDCVNPSHMEPVTHAENSRRACSPFTEDMVRDIRARVFDAGSNSRGVQLEIAKEYGVTATAISQIVLRKTWKDVV